MPRLSRDTTSHSPHGHRDHHPFDCDAFQRDASATCGMGIARGHGSTAHQPRQRRDAKSGRMGGGGADGAAPIDANRTLRTAVRAWLTDPNEARRRYGPLSNWDTTGVTDMSMLFYRAEHFNEPLNDWNTSLVTTMSSMFSDARRFNQPLNDWNTSQVTKMGGMFYLADQFDQPLNDWNTSQVTDMSMMFAHANHFNQPLNDWDVGQVTIMMSMFFHADHFNQPLNDWDVGQVRSMVYMFNHAVAFNQPLHQWDMRSVVYQTDMFDMFGGAPWMLQRYPDGRIPWREWRLRMMRRRELVQLLPQKNLPMDLLPLFESHL